MVRIASINDAEQLERLNIEFNGEGETTLEQIKTALSQNAQEFIVVDDADGVLTGFVCIQLKRSFCYSDCMPEITEVYVNPQYRCRGIARAMIRYAEEYCKTNVPCHKLELLTGAGNTGAQAVYRKLGYSEDGELHLVKRWNEAE